MNTKALPVSIFLIAALAAMPPLAVDAYLPAMPSIANALMADIHAVELSLSLFLGGFAIGQLIGGPFSDRFGRRKSIALGIVFFLIGSLIIVFCPSIEWLWAGRIVQALGGGLAVVNSSAIIRDVSSGKDSARLMSHMAIIMMLAPLLAPTLGMLLMKLGGWRTIFIFLVLYAIALVITLYFRLPETRIKSAVPVNVWQRYKMVLSHRKAMSYLFSQCFAYAGMFAFITASPLVYMEYFGVSTTVYPFLFGGNILCMVTANRINVFLLRRYQPSQLLSIGQTIQLVMGSLLVAYLLLAPTLSLYVIVGLVMLFVGSHAFIVSNATASTVEFFPTNSGTATALMGASGFFAGAFSGAFVSMLGDGSPWPMAIVMASCAVLSPLMRFILNPPSAA